MILRRLGNKNRISQNIIKHFPKHESYIEPFFGTGSIFFNKSLVKYNFLNDIDSEIHNLFLQVRFNKENLKNELQSFPYHKDCWNWIKTQNFDEPVLKATKFIVLSNYGFLGKPDTIKYGLDNHKQHLIENLDKTFDLFCKNTHLQFNNCDFRNFIKQIFFRDENSFKKSFCYSDPPYLGTGDNYNMQSNWTEKDVIDCMDITFNSGFKGAMSEFNHPFILQQAKERNLNVITIGERQNLKNRRTEILILNYQVAKSLFDDCN
jgi:DNA adenine methylase